MIQDDKKLQYKLQDDVKRTVNTGEKVFMLWILAEHYKKGVHLSRNLGVNDKQPDGEEDEERDADFAGNKTITDSQTEQRGSGNNNLLLTLNLLIPGWLHPESCQSCWCQREHNWGRIERETASSSLPIHVIIIYLFWSSLLCHS